MRFSTIAVTFVAFAAQATLTSAGADSYISCRDDVEPCWKVVPIGDTCGPTVTYCLQRRDDAADTCNMGTWSHANVWVAGNPVDLGNAPDPEAYCPEGDGFADADSCHTGSGNSCTLLDDFNLVTSTNNIGFKCGSNIQEGPCVTVAVDNAEGNHAQVIFSIKDKSGCEEDPVEGVLQCLPYGDNNNCACSGGSACIFEPIRSCTPPPPTGEGGVNGDPHFKTWRGHHFDFHGECDLVLLRSSEFGSGVGLDVHIRTKLRRDMSYISSATLRISTDVLQVDSQGIYYLNGVAGAELPPAFGGFEFLHTQPTGKQHVFEVHLGVRERIKVKTYKDFVSVLIEQGQSKHFGDSVGLMGDFAKGRMLARDGQTILDDANAFGQEWQVLDTEATLFQTIRFPQHPSVCTLPPPMQASQIRRRLLESSVDELAAEKACEHWGEGKDDCVFDVLTTGDLEMAMVGAY